MARPLRIIYEGAVYHVTIRGNNRRDIFKANGDREHFIAKLGLSGLSEDFQDFQGSALSLSFKRFTMTFWSFCTLRSVVSKLEIL